MSGRHQPTAGADSQDYGDPYLEWGKRHDRNLTCPACRDATPHAFRVKLATDDGDQWIATVASAIGPHDAMGVAEDTARKQGYIYPQAYAVEHAGGAA